MNEKEIKQQVIEKLETLLEIARNGGSLRLVAALSSDDTVSTATVGTGMESAILLFGWTKGDIVHLSAMEIAAGAARQMIEEGKFDETAQ